jgi:hypothetical protein
VVRFPAKLGLEGNLVLPADVFTRQMGFGGESRVALGHFSQPKGFWRGISGHKFNPHTKKAVSKPENPVLALIQLLFVLQYKRITWCLTDCILRVTFVIPIILIDYQFPFRCQPTHHQSDFHSKHS